MDDIENSFSLDVSGESLPDYEAVIKTIKKQQKFYAKTAIDSESLGLLLKLENVVRGDLADLTCCDNGLPA